MQFAAVIVTVSKKTQKVIQYKEVSLKQEMKITTATTGNVIRCVKLCSLFYIVNENRCIIGRKVTTKTMEWNVHMPLF